jgi:hypothetical protein
MNVQQRTSPFDTPETIEIPLAQMVAKAAAVGSVTFGAASNSIFTAVGGMQGLTGAAAATSGAKAVGLGIGMAWGVPVLLSVGAVAMGGAMATFMYRVTHTVVLAVYRPSVNPHRYVQFDPNEFVLDREGLHGVLVGTGHVDVRGRARDEWKFSFAFVNNESPVLNVAVDEAVAAATNSPWTLSCRYQDGRRVS